MTFWLVIGGAWLLCAIGAAGFHFAYFQDKYPILARKEIRQDCGNAWIYGLVFGPIALVVVFFLSGFGEYGWRLPRLSSANRSA